MNSVTVALSSIALALADIHQRSYIAIRGRTRLYCNCSTAVKSIPTLGPLPVSVVFVLVHPMEESQNEMWHPLTGMQYQSPYSDLATFLRQSQTQVRSPCD